MRVLRFLHSRQMILSLSLASFLTLAGGCSEENPVAAVGEAKGKEIGAKQAQARQEAFGNKTGAPVGKPQAKPADAAADAPAK